MQLYRQDAVLWSPWSLVFVQPWSSVLYKTEVGNKIIQPVISDVANQPEVRLDSTTVATANRILESNREAYRETNSTTPAPP